MLDPNLIYKNIDKISEKLSKKGYLLNSQEFKTLYENRKDIIQKAEALKEEQNIFTKKISKEAINNKLNVFDATCPLVTKVHLEAIKLYNSCLLYTSPSPRD